MNFYSNNYQNPSTAQQPLTPYNLTNFQNLPSNSAGPPQFLPTMNPNPSPPPYISSNYQHISPLLPNTTPPYGNIYNGYQMQNPPASFSNNMSPPQEYLITSRQIGNQQPGYSYNQELMPQHNNVHNHMNLIQQAQCPCPTNNIQPLELSLSHQIILKQLEKQNLETMLLQDVIKKNPFSFQFHYDCQTQTTDSSSKGTEALKIDPGLIHCSCNCNCNKQSHVNNLIQIDASAQQKLKPSSVTENSFSKMKTLNLTKSQDIKCVPDMAMFMQSYLNETNNQENQKKINEQATLTVHVEPMNQGIQCDIISNDYEFAEAIIETLCNSLQDEIDEREYEFDEDAFNDDRTLQIQLNTATILDENDPSLKDQTQATILDENNPSKKLQTQLNTATILDENDPSLKESSTQKDSGIEKSAPPQISVHIKKRVSFEDKPGQHRPIIDDDSDNNNAQSSKETN